MKSLLLISAAFFTVSTAVASAQDAKSPEVKSEITAPEAVKSDAIKIDEQSKTMSEEAASIKAQSKVIREEMETTKNSQTARCPEGTTAQPDKSCMVTGEFAVKPHKKSKKAHEKGMKAPAIKKDADKTDMSDKVKND